MTQESPAKNPIAADSSSEDLSAEIARTVEKGSREQVTCRRIGPQIPTRLTPVSPPP